MNVTEAVAAVYLKSTGKTTTLASTSSKYQRIFGLLNFYSRRWSRETGVDWNSLYDPAFPIGNVTATDTYDLDTSTIRKISAREGDSIRVVWTDGITYTDYALVDSDTLKDYYWGADKTSFNGFYVAQIGSTLVFNHSFTTDDAQFGGNIQVPCYLFTDDLVNPTDDIQVNDPDWLVTRVSAEYVRNDITRRQRYPELLTEANDIMERMKDDNEGQIVTVNMPWSPPSGIGVDSAWS